jgi:Asp-tRNA(Asn)/Glu-tRNA(Gln) amidotransferase A subunit family amidase
MKILLDEELTSLDATVIPRPWSPATIEKYTVKRLKFGYYFDDGVTISSPPVKRAILETVAALRQQGHQCIQITPPNVIEAVHIFAATTSNNGSPPLGVN